MAVWDEYLHRWIRKRTCCDSFEGTDHYRPCPVADAREAALEVIIRQRVSRVRRVAGHRQRIPHAGSGA